MAVGMAVAMKMVDDTEGPASGRPIDLVHLSRHSLGNRELEQEILRLFVRQSALYLERLKVATTARARAEAAHTIKGSAKGIGAWRVARLAEAVENPPAADYAMAIELMGDLEAAVAEANAYIDAIID
ncbi:MAG TPA: Hpt domain-containing protein [Kaistiaceae bacterium]|nr:Hpt domain-containing protein [Kaistiaceae bacterium]